MTFAQCVLQSARNQDLVREFDRLYGCNMSLKGRTMELAIDKASGRLDSDCLTFINFVFDCVWMRLSPDARNDRKPVFWFGKRERPDSEGRFRMNMTIDDEPYYIIGEGDAITVYGDPDGNMVLLPKEQMQQVRDALKGW